MQQYVFTKVLEISQWIEETDKHHIVARKSRFALSARLILVNGCGIDIDDPINIANVKRSLHWFFAY